MKLSPDTRVKQNPDEVLGLAASSRLFYMGLMLALLAVCGWASRMAEMFWPASTSAHGTTTMLILRMVATLHVSLHDLQVWLMEFAEYMIGLVEDMRG